MDDWPLGGSRSLGAAQNLTERISVSREGDALCFLEGNESIPYVPGAGFGEFRSLL